MILLFDFFKAIPIQKYGKREFPIFIKTQFKLEIQIIEHQ